MRHGLAGPLVALVLASPLLTDGADAAPITYTETTTAAGTLGGTAFVDNQVTVSIAGDTSEVATFAPGILVGPVGIASVSVAGLGTATFTTSAVALDDQVEPGAGIGLTSGPSNVEGHPPLILGVYASAFATYDLTGAVGPVTGPSQIDAGVALQTSDGVFVLTSANDVTFTAATVPEPVSTALVSAGLLGFGLTKRRARAAPHDR